MDYRKMIKLLESDHFTKIINKCSWFEKEAILYVKEINDNIFLLFVMANTGNIKNIRVVIASFTCIENIGIEEPEQTLLYLSIKHDQDLRYFEKYIDFSHN